ncbi:hypothetical protein KC323_g837 [Hortaea werneckii]|nr:hypothetical protein KC323_g837 [Hortaea werneckii]
MGQRLSRFLDCSPGKENEAGQKRMGADKDEERLGARHVPADDGGAGYAGLSEVAVPPPIQNRDDRARTYRHTTLEDER